MDKKTDLIAKHKFAEGQVVNHKKYGRGIFIGYTEDGSLARVRFDSGIARAFYYTALLEPDPAGPGSEKSE